MTGLFHELYSVPAGGLSSNTHCVLTTEARLQNMVADINTKLVKLVERRNLEMTDTQMLAGYVVDSTTAVHHFMRG